jgi:hypothetical protein
LFWWEASVTFNRFKTKLKHVLKIPNFTKIRSVVLEFFDTKLRTKRFSQTRRRSANI